MRFSRILFQSINDKQSRTAFCKTAMTWLAVTHVIAHPGLQSKRPPIGQPRLQFPIQAQQYMPLRAPVIRLVIRRILHHAHANLSKHLRPPQRFTAVARVLGHRYLAPVSRRERRLSHFHNPKYIPAASQPVLPWNIIKTLSLHPPCHFAAFRATLSLRLLPRLCCAVPRLLVNASPENPRLQFPPYVFSVI